MAQISGFTPASAPVAAEPFRNDRARAHAVEQAVTRLNALQAAGEGREITFSVDAATKRPVVKVVDVNTHETVQQWPAEYVLRLDANKRRDSR